MVKIYLSEERSRNIDPEEGLNYEQHEKLFLIVWMCLDRMDVFGSYGCVLIEWMGLDRMDVFGSYGCLQIVWMCV